MIKKIFYKLFLVAGVSSALSLSVFSTASAQTCDPISGNPGDYTCQPTITPPPTGCTLEDGGLMICDEGVPSGYTCSSCSTTGAPAGQLSSSSGSIQQGKSVTLTWHTTNAVGCSINSTSVDPNGSKSFEVDATTNFALSCQGTGAGATVQTLNTITVTATPPPSTVTPPRNATPAPVTNCPAGQICYTPLEPLLGVDESGGSQSLSSVLNFAFRTLFTIGGLMAVFWLIVGGIAYMTSEVAGKKDDAKKRIRGAIYGLVILIVSYLILNTINPELLQFNIGVFSPTQLIPPSSTNAPATFTTASALQQFTNDCIHSGKHVTTNKDPDGQTTHECI